MKIDEKKILAFLSIMSLGLSMSITLKGKEDAAAECKKANQTCLITIIHGEETKYPGLLTI
jgi:hypothetical protein